MVIHLDISYPILYAQDVSHHSEKPLVVIRTLVYNHAPFLHDYFRGILMQETNFPFVAIVHDDASTDDSAAIIREYAAKHPDIIRPILETENQYSKRDGSLRRIMDAAAEAYSPRYAALCEADDYWTDPRKLQKQVDYLEAHPECTMVVCHGTIIKSGRTYRTEAEYRELNFPHPGEKERDIDLRELTERPGSYLLTAGIIYRSFLRKAYPPAFKSLPFGDSQLKLMAAMEGTIHYLPDDMVTYRLCSSDTAASSRSLAKKPQSFNEIPWRKVVDMYDAADQYSKGRHADIFRVAAVRSAVKQTWQNPKLRREILRHWKHIFSYTYLREAEGFHREQSRHRISFFIKRLLYFPHYPMPGAQFLLSPLILFFYAPSPRGAAFGFGPLHLCSYLKEGGRLSFYVAGRKAFSLPC